MIDRQTDRMAGNEYVKMKPKSQHLIIFHLAQNKPFLYSSTATCLPNGHNILIEFAGLLDLAICILIGL